MNCFDFLKIYKNIEDLRIKNAIKINYFLKKFANCYVEKINKILRNNQFILAISLIMIMAGMFLRSTQIFDNLQIFSAKNTILSVNKSLNFTDFINQFFFNFIEKFHFSNFLVAEIIVQIIGISSIIICFFLIKNSIFNNDRVGRNLFILANIFIYFLSFNFENNSILNLNKHYLLSLYIIYLSSIVSNYNQKKIIYNLFYTAIILLLILLKMQNIILVFFGELFLYFRRKEIKNHSFFLIRFLLNTIFALGLYHLILNIPATLDIFNDIKNWDFFSHKFINNNLLSEIYKNQNSIGFFEILSKEILLIFLLIFSYQQSLKFDFTGNSVKINQQNQIKLNYFWIVFCFSFLMIFCEKKIDQQAIELFLILNFPSAIIILFAVFLAQKFDFRRHGIIIAIIALIAISDSKIFFEIFKYLPNFWYIFLIIFANKLRSKINKNPTEIKLNYIEQFFILRGYKSIILLISLIIIFLLIEFKINYLMSFFI